MEGLTFGAKWVYAFGMMEQIGMERSLNGSEMLKPGVYRLSLHGRVVFVGRAKCMLAAIADHRSTCGSKRLPEWFPIKAVQFDSIEYFPMSYDRTKAFADGLTAIHFPHRAPTASPTPDQDRRAPPAANRIERRI